ncbi:MAG: O-antigen ligase family protein [Solirubrobacterales bacterium]
MNNTKQTVPFGVAAAIVLISLAEGGYSVELRAAVAILAWGTVLIGLALGAFPRVPTPRAALVSGLLLALLALLTVASAWWASDNGAAVEEFLRVSAYLGVFALAVCLSGRDPRPWLVGIAIGITAVGAFAVLGRLIPGLPGGDDEIREFLPAARGRLSYPIGYWNAIAAMFALGIVLLVWLSATARRVAARAFAAAFIPVLGLCIYLTSSRGGLAALLVGVIALIAIGPRRLPLLGGAAVGALGSALVVLLANGQTALLDDVVGTEAETQGVELLGALLACMVFALAVRTVADGPLMRISIPPAVGRWVAAGAAVLAIGVAIAANPSERFDEFKQPPAAISEEDDFVAAHLGSGSGSGRWQFWGEALDAFGSEPLRGIGAGGYEYYWNQHAPIDQVTGEAHSLYLEQLAELGPLGLLLVVAVLAIAAWRGLSQRRRFPGGEAGVAVAALVTAAVSAGIDWTWEVPAVFGIVVLILAILTGPALASRPGGDGAAEGSGFGWGVATIVVAWLSIIVAFGSLLGERSLQASREAARDRDLETAAEEAREAIAVQGWSAEPRLQLALVQERAGDLDAARESIDEAIDRSPEDWELWLVSARLATLVGDLGDANAALEQARRLNPRSPVLAAAPQAPTEVAPPAP